MVSKEKKEITANVKKSISEHFDMLLPRALSNV
jgi:hypothetical protein